MTTAGKRHKALAALLAVALVFAGVGSTVAVEQPTASDNVVTGHTSFVEAGTGFSGCFAGVAGLIMERVTWFNGAELFSRPTGSGQWVYLTEAFKDTSSTGIQPPGQYDDDTGIRIKDPSDEKLFRTDNTYRFNVPIDQDGDGDIDSAGPEWVVKEYFALREQMVGQDEEGDPEIRDGAKRVYVYAVKIAADTYTAYSLGNAEYNFVGVVDTCRFHGDGTTKSHDPDQDLPDQHNETDPDPHPHGQFGVDIWIGGEPDAIPVTEEQGGVPDDRDNSSSATGDASNGEP